MHFLREHGPRLVELGYPIIPIAPPDAGEGQADRRDWGKAPGRWNGWQWTGFKDWQKVGVPSAAELKEWLAFEPCGIGIAAGTRCGDGSYLTLVDIDVRDPDLSEELDALAVSTLGRGPLRIGAAPKRGRVYRIECGIPKRRPSEFNLPGDPEGAKGHAVEILGTGNQFVAYGIHPGTRRPYGWPEGDLADWRPGDLPTVTGEQLATFLQEAEARFVAVGAVRRTRLKGDGTGSRQAPKSLEQLRARDPEQIRAALSFIPNDDLHYDDWVRIGLAIKGAFGEDGWPLFEEWSARSGKYVPEITGTVWEGLAPKIIGAGTIWQLAWGHGWRPPAVEFEPVGGIPLAEGERQLRAAVSGFFDRAVPDFERKAADWRGRGAVG